MSLSAGLGLIRPMPGTGGTPRRAVAQPGRMYGAGLPVASAGMQPRRHRMRQQQRRDSAGAWIVSGATITVKAYAKRYGVDRYTAYDDLTALGFP